MKADINMNGELVLIPESNAESRAIDDLLLHTPELVRFVVEDRGLIMASGEKRLSD